MLPSFIPSDLLLAQYSLVGKHPEFGTDRFDKDCHYVESFKTPKYGEITTIAAVATGVGLAHYRLAKASAHIVTATFIEVFEKRLDEDVIDTIKNVLDLSRHRLTPLESAVAVAAVIVQNHNLYMVSIGDCRAFLMRDGKIQQISVTHTLAETAIKQGLITAQEFDGDHIIYDAWTPSRLVTGFEGGGEPDFRLQLHDDESDEQALANQGLELKSDDRIILCSSGVFGHWKSPHRWQLFEEYFLRPTENIQETVEQFVHAVRDQGGFHSLTVVMLQIP